MKTRRFKSLATTMDGTPYFIDKIMVYDDNGKRIDCCAIHKQEDGQEYYSPSNTKPGAVLGLFVDRIKDAVDCIRDGYGDVISVGGLFRSISVNRFIDREYGERLREKSIEGWKDTKFEYAIKFSWLSSFSPGYNVAKNGKSSYEKTNLLTFQSEDLAKEHISKLIKLAEDYYKKYCELSAGEDSDNAIRELMDTMKTDGYDTSSVVFDLVYGMEREDQSKTNQKQYKICPVQVLSQKNKEE